MEATEKLECRVEECGWRRPEVMRLPSDGKSLLKPRGRCGREKNLNNGTVRGSPSTEGD